MTDLGFVDVMDVQLGESMTDRGQPHEPNSDDDTSVGRVLRCAPERGGNGMTICCADIGSVARGNFGWASLSLERGRETRSGTDIREFAEFVARRLADSEGKVSLGFECPLWIPVADEPCKLTQARDGERDRAWSAAAGAGSLATGLAEVAWILDYVRQESRDKEAFLDWNLFKRVQSGLFIWEALVTGKGKTDSHESDAKAAVDAFQRALPDPISKNALTSTSRTRSLIGAALLWAGWSNDIGLLSRPCVVIQSER